MPKAVVKVLVIAVVKVKVVVVAVIVEITPVAIGEVSMVVTAAVVIAAVVKEATFMLEEVLTMAELSVSKALVGGGKSILEVAFKEVAI